MSINVVWARDVRRKGQRKDGYQWTCRRMNSASACCASTSIRHGSGFRQSKLNFMEVLFITYDIVRRVAARTIQQKHICSIDTRNR